MTGKSFFAAAADAIGLIIRNPIRFAVVGGLGEVFVAVGRLFISLLTGLGCYFVITKSAHF
jgi:solute carrier family 44 protein 1 (choline transporter-like protein)/choline transporter-like protein 2/4/5